MMNLESGITIVYPELVPSLRGHHAIADDQPSGLNDERLWPRLLRDGGLSRWAAERIQQRRTTRTSQPRLDVISVSG